MSISPELMYLLLVVGLFIVPRGLQRFRLPGAITSLGLGAVASIGFHAFHGDSTIELLGTLGIVTLFLFAGLEVEWEELSRGKRALAWHVAAQVALLGVSAMACARLFDLAARPALLFSLALFTPSTGFILDSLHSMGLTAEEQYWVKAKAIAAELVALLVLFVTVQSAEVPRLGLSTLAIVAFVAVLPWVFRGFDRIVAPFAPRSEFTFLILTALLAAHLTRALGVYYLVGAFIVGVVATRMRHMIPALSSPQLTTSVELFASFFIPFYFFKAGLHLQAEFFTLKSVAIAVALLVVVAPIRILRVAAHRHWGFGESWGSGLRIGTAMVPTLVFTIVLAEILRDRFQLAPELFGALIVFTLGNTLIPGFTLRTPVAEFESPKLGQEQVEAQ
ncbi:MAG: cation:proton antiporter [Bryobacterales bacterium]|nr:cation:proton antiporter [Bryobacterales bacterium]